MATQRIGARSALGAPAARHPERPIRPFGVRGAGGGSVSGMDNPIVALHGYLVGFAIIGSWATIMCWSLALRFLDYDETPMFWRAVSVAQILLAVQLLLGLILLGRYLLDPTPQNLPGDASAFQVSFHVLYGVVFPLIVLLVAHKGARDGRFNPYSAFAVVGLVNFGLTARAWMVGVPHLG
jgi:hypothetical protein